MFANDSNGHDKETDVYQDNEHHWDNECQHKVSWKIQPAAAKGIFSKDINLKCVHLSISTSLRTLWITNIMGLRGGTEFRKLIPFNVIIENSHTLKVEVV